VGFLGRLFGGSKTPGDDPVRLQARSLYDTLFKEGEPQGHEVVPKDLPTGRQILKACTPEIQVAILLIAFSECQAVLEGKAFAAYRFCLARGLFISLTQRKLDVPPDRVVAMLEACAKIDEVYTRQIPIPSLLTLISKPPTRDELRALGALRNALTRARFPTPQKILDRVDGILAGDRETSLTRGPWSARILGEIADFEPEQRAAWRDLVVHLGAVRNSAPSPRWTKRLEEHLAAVGQPSFVRYALGWLSLAPLPNQPKPPSDPEIAYLKGFVWALRGFDDPSVPRVLADLAERCMKKVPNRGPICAGVANTCIRALGEMKGEAAVAQLGRLRARVKYSMGAQLINRGLTEAAVRAGLSPEELEEIAIPTFDLDRLGSLRRTVGAFTAEIRITGTDDVALTWSAADGRALKSVPAAVRQQHAGDLTGLKKTAKDIASILPGQRARLERLFEDDRAIPFDAWRERYAEHPVVGQMSRRLIWLFSEGGRSEPGVFHDGRVVDGRDQPMEWWSPATVVQLWHPLGSPTDVVLDWRRWLERHAITQPFKQAHREIYLLTDAERTTDVYSNRFAAHILRQHQFAALCRDRGWKYDLRAMWDAPITTPWHRLRRWDLEIQFSIDALDDHTRATDSGVYQYIRTDQVRFSRRGTPVRLEEVPPLAFSEAMRDVDLFVGVCSVGNDPEWADRGAEPYGDYWRAYSFGDLSESAKTRRAALEALLPKLRCADRLSLGERSLIVRGDIGTYNIHLGSGNVLMEPGTRYLCIVAEQSLPFSGPRVWLPFEGDRTLSIILSKALMLAADTKITDPLIVRQIGRAL
jgi:hypothetical protein